MRILVPIPVEEVATDDSGTVGPAVGAREAARRLRAGSIGSPVDDEDAVVSGSVTGLVDGAPDVEHDAVEPGRQ